MNTSKTRLGKNYHNYKAFQNETKANVKRTMGEKGVRKTIDNVYGYGGNASRQKAASNYYDRKSTYTKTRLGTTAAKASSFNEKTAAQANQRLHNSKGIEKTKNYVDSVANRPIKTWSGRTTTTGKRTVDILLTGGIVGTVKDINYYRKNK